jgi:hypothetical protein
MNTEKTIWINHERWACGDGCCSDSWYNVTIENYWNDSEDRRDIQDIVDDLKADYPNHKIVIESLSDYDEWPEGVEEE